MNEIQNVRFTTDQKTNKHLSAWENAQLITLGLTILGQITVGASFFIGQSAWLIANVISVTRDFILHRPLADKVKDITLLAITTGLIVASIVTLL